MSADQLALSKIEELESESIFVLREAAAAFKNPVLLYSVGKDSSVLLRLSQKAFYPNKVPYSFMHIDTGFKFNEIYKFRDRIARQSEINLVISSNQSAIRENANPRSLGTQQCCGLLKTKALLDALAEGSHDAAIGGARRDEEKSRAKERIFSIRDKGGVWNRHAQRPELWNLYNSQMRPDQSMRIFPLSNWTELDIWSYIIKEGIEVCPLYFAKNRQMIVRGSQLIAPSKHDQPSALEPLQTIECRFRSLGCSPCTGAIRSSAKNAQEVFDELRTIRLSERQNRAIDYDEDSSMEIKKSEGYF